MTPFTCYLSSTFLQPPALPPGIQFLSTVYPDRSRNVLDDPRRPGLHAVTEAGYKAPSVWDPKAVNELAEYLKAAGVKDYCIDWEAADTAENNDVLRKVVTRLRAKGVRPDLYGVTETALELTRNVHAVWAPFTTDHDLYVRRRREALLDLRKRCNGRRVGGWVYTTYGLDGDGPDNDPIPVGQYIGDDSFRRYLREVFAKCDFVVWWPGMGADGWRRPGELPEGWDVFAEFAAKAAGQGS